MKIYTKTGDAGTTALFGGTRVPKHNIRIESYGTVDELNSYLGLIRTQEIDPRSKEILVHIQDRLFTLGAILATDPEKATLKSGKERLNIPKIEEEDIILLENEMDRMNDSLPPMTHFILPGGNTTVSYCHIARTVCRRAERSILSLGADAVEPVVIIYVNRLSDLLFTMARAENHRAGTTETPW